MVKHWDSSNLYFFNFIYIENQTNRVLCILSDGEDHEIENKNITEIVKNSGITIITEQITNKLSSMSIEILLYFF